MAYNEIRTINNIQLEDIRARQSIQELDNKKANKSDIVNGLNFKGTTTYSALPTSDNSVGDFYYVTDGDGTNGEGNYAWNGTAWYFSGKTTDFGDISTKANAAVNNAAFEEGKLKVNKNDGASTETEVVDSSLTKSGKAADAKVTGDALAGKAVIDDTTVGTDAWSSKHLVDMLCPPLEETGNPVQCYPVANYPLGVVTSWEPVQEGSGDPSPENIRTINGRDSVTVERRGENLIKYPAAGKTNGIEITVDGSKLTVKGTCPSSTSIKSDAVYYPDGEYTLSSDVLIPAGAYISVYIKIEKLLLSKNHRNATGKLSGNAQMLLYLEAGTYDFAVQVSLVPGSTPPTEYTPYRGDTLALALSSTIYGGTVDAVTGEGQETWKLITLDGKTNKFSSGTTYWNLPRKSAIGVGDWYLNNIYSSHFTNVFGGNAIENFIYTTPAIMAKYFQNADALNAYLAAQYAAGTPVQICYKLKTLTSFTATGAQPISALSGVNTVLTDADSATVTGRADPIKRITDLEDAVASMTTT